MYSHSVCPCVELFSVREGEQGESEGRRVVRYPDAQQLFVGNVPHDVDKTELKEFFERKSGQVTLLQPCKNTMAKENCTKQQQCAYKLIFIYIPKLTSVLKGLYCLWDTRHPECLLVKVPRRTTDGSSLYLRSGDVSSAVLFITLKPFGKSWMIESLNKCWSV